MIGPRAGVRVGPRVGIAAGVSADEIFAGGASDPMASVARDATSGIYCPATLAQWNTVLSVAGVPITLNAADLWIWLCDEGAGNLVDEVNALALAPNAAPSYSNVVAGWARPFVGMADGTAGQRFSSTDASLPDLSTTSALLLTYTQVTATPAGVRGVSDMGTTTTESRITTVPNARLVSGASPAANGASVNVGTAVRPWLHVFNQTIDDDTLYTDQDKIVATFGATVTGKAARLGATSGAAAGPLRHGYAVKIQGSKAEWTSTQSKAVLQTLGWAGISWS